MTLKYNISYEVASIIFLIVLLFYIGLQYDTHSKLNQEFRKLTLLGLIATTLDVTTAITISYPYAIPVKVNVLLNTLYFLSVAALGYQVMHYDMYYVYREKTNKSFARFNQLLIGICVIMYVINYFTGIFFYFTEDRVYVRGPIHPAVYIPPAYFVLTSGIILLFNFRKFRVWQRISIFLFVSFQIFGMILQMVFFPDTLLALFMSALGMMMMLFTMETPDYQKLVITIEELRETKKMAEAAKEEAEKAREIAQKANQAKSDFLANMSHEIRTPINAVLGMDEMIIRESTNPQILGYASDIKHAGNMLLALINDILDFSKIESGKMNIIPVDYNLGVMLCDTVDMIRSRAEEKNLQLECKIAPDTPVHLCGDEVRIRQILTNILTNAVKYTPEGKVILTVSGKNVSPDVVQLYVSVKDTGIGIKEEDIERLFDSFQRVDESRNRNIEGTGLGLSITMRLLNLMGSRLEVESIYGTGSNFYFTLEQKKLDDEIIGENIQKYSESKKGRAGISTEQFYAPNARILVVDDNEMNLKVFVGLLKNYGMQIDMARSGKECLARIEKNAYHIIFMDHLMPEMDGVETLKRIKELKTNQSKDAVIIVLTANAVSGAREMFLQEGFDDYLSKPIIATKLEKMIRDYLPEEVLWTKEAALNTPGPKEEIYEKSQEYDKEAGAQNCLLDWEKGFAFCMEDESFYREMLQIFLESTAPMELQKHYAESDFHQYCIKVHGIKTNLANIGAMDVSDMAKQLELALKVDQDVSYVLDNHEEFMAAYEQVVSEVKTYLASER